MLLLFMYLVCSSVLKLSINFQAFNLSKEILTEPDRDQIL